MYSLLLYLAELTTEPPSLARMPLAHGPYYVVYKILPVAVAENNRGFRQAGGGARERAPGVADRSSTRSQRSHVGVRRTTCPVPWTRARRSSLCRPWSWCRRRPSRLRAP